MLAFGKLRKSNKSKNIMRSKFAVYAHSKKGNIHFWSEQGKLFAFFFVNVHARQASFENWNPNARYQVDGQIVVCRHIAFSVAQFIISMGSNFCASTLIRNFNDSDRNIFLELLLAEYYKPQPELYYKTSLVFSAYKFGLCLYHIGLEMKPGGFKHFVFFTPNHVMNLFIKYKAAKYGKPTRFVIMILDPNGLAKYFQLAVDSLNDLLLVNIEHIVPSPLKNKYKLIGDETFEFHSTMHDYVNVDAIQALLDNDVIRLAIEQSRNPYYLLACKALLNNPSDALYLQLMAPYHGHSKWSLLYEIPALKLVFSELIFNLSIHHINFILGLCKVESNKIVWFIGHEWPNHCLYYKRFLEEIMIALHENYEGLQHIFKPENDLAYLVLLMVKRVFCAGNSQIRMCQLTKSALLIELKRPLNDQHTVEDIVRQHFPKALLALQPYINPLQNNQRSQFFKSLEERLGPAKLSLTSPRQDRPTAITKSIIMQC